MVLVSFFSMVGVMSQYFGEPINCDFKGIDGEMASDYCWIHGSTYIPPEHQVTTFSNYSLCKEFSGKG